MIVMFRRDHVVGFQILPPPNRSGRDAGSSCGLKQRLAKNDGLPDEWEESHTGPQAPLSRLDASFTADNRVVLSDNGGTSLSYQTSTRSWRSTLWAADDRSWCRTPNAGRRQITDMTSTQRPLTVSTTFFCDFAAFQIKMSGVRSVTSERCCTGWMSDDSALDVARTQKAATTPASTHPPPPPQ